ncbi:MAG: nuclear transport factor 2 family protein [Hyphomicrobiaceae bacterium]|nr:nuclear transport factor 2 family protein [Hyphomicrobiaceae bacterium]
MTKEVEAIVDAFNGAINRRDLEGLSRLMTSSHRFVDSAGGAVSGKWACLDAWWGFFSAFPDYRNQFDRMIATGNKVVILGTSTCPDHRLAGPVLWQATISAHLVDEWRVFEDTPANRIILGIPV